MKANFDKRQATCVVQVLQDGPPLGAAIAALCEQPDACILESAAGDAPYGRYTICGIDPARVLQVDAYDGSAIDLLAEAVSATPTCAPPPHLPLAGGWIGFISYEAGPAVQGINHVRRPDQQMPAARFALFDTLAIFDRALQRWSLVGLDWPAGTFADRLPVQARLQRLLDILRNIPEPATPDLSVPVCPPPVPGVDRSRYIQQVLQIKRYIEAGDVYQVNLTRRFTTETDAAPADLYRRLRLANPADFAALIRWDDNAVISSSPELFLHLRDGVAVTRPIKGTRPRVGDPLLDEVRRVELLHSPKDRAELTMIIDLLRNDLGRVSQFGSVQVLQAAQLEPHPTVYHLVGTIQSRLRPEHDWADLLRASFPGGSITGAPKIRAMQIIDELEEHSRGVYCGCMGYVGLDGSMMMNIAIRTMELCSGRLSISAGGGIVADSDPEEEFEETLAKAAGMLRALGHASVGYQVAR